MVKKVSTMRGGFKLSSSPTKLASKRFMLRKRVAANAFKKAKPIIKEAFGELTMAGARKAQNALEKEMKKPIGSNGLALGPTRLDKFANQSLNSTAVGSSTYSNTFYAYRPKVTLRSPRQRYVMKTSIRTNFESASERQGAGDVSLLDAVPVLNNPNSDSKYSNLSIKKAFDTVLRARMFSGSTAVEQPESNTVIHLDNVTGEFLITNGSTASEVTIFDCIPQYDLGPSTYSTESYALGYMSPYWCWAQGLQTDTLELGDNLSQGRLGSVPTDSVTFSRAWKIIKRTKIRMTADAVHKHNFVCGINKSIPYQRYAQADTGGGKFGGYCPTTMIVTRGLPTSAAQAPVTSVNISCNLELHYSSNLNQATQAIVYDITT
mgnify:CR=1 FL=1|jgi:hypothetical protein